MRLVMRKARFGAGFFLTALWDGIDSTVIPLLRVLQGVLTVARISAEY